MQNIQVEVQKDHIERITSAKPIAALAELIWNAYDADAKKVIITFEEGPISKLGKILVTDDGIGIDPNRAESLFKFLGGSWKNGTLHTSGGRFIHGEKGQGRFKAFSLGESVKWISRANGKKFSINGKLSDLKNFPMLDIDSCKETGCEVEISNIPKDYQIRAEHGADEAIRDIFALQLYEDRNFQIIYDGIEIDARDAIREVSTIDLSIKQEDGTEISGVLEIVEWNKKVERKLMLCLPGRFSFYEMAPGIQARGFDFTAYLTSKYYQKLADSNTESLVELDPVANALIESAKDKLREYFRKREVELSRGKIQEWKDARIYPYEGITSDPIERNERQVFDVVALNLADYSSEFEKTPIKTQKLILQLIKTAVETGGTSLPNILEKVIGLPKNKQEELAELLRKTTLTAVINAAKSVTDRLDFLKALQILIFDPVSKKQLLERSQLHRIIAQETWIFGEQFNLMNDDEDLTSVLKSHLSSLDRDRKEIAQVAPVLDASGKVAIVDLLLSKRVPTPTDEERKHLVVELKRPSQPINEDVISQIKKYAKAVAKDSRFRACNVEWDFLAISNSFTPDAELEARQVGRPIGLVAEYDDLKIRVWAKTWGQIITEAEGRLTFYRRRLEYQANDTEALNYLKTINENYLSDEVREKISELADE